MSTEATGCLRVCEKFQPYHISAIDEPILKSFEVVRFNTGRFGLVSLDGLYVVITLLKCAMTFGLSFEHKDFSGEIRCLREKFWA